MYRINPAESDTNWQQILFGLLLIELIAGIIYAYNSIIFLSIFIGLPLVILVQYYILNKPFFWILLLVVTSGLDTWGRIAGGITSFHISWILSILGIIAFILFQHYDKFKFRTPINNYVFLYVLVSALSLVYSPNFSGGLSYLSTTIALFVFYLFAINFTSKVQHHRAIVFTLILINVFVSFIIFYQLFNYDPWHIVHPIEIAGGEKILRPSGTFDDPNVTAAFLMIGIIYALSFVFYSKEQLSYKVVLIFGIIISIAGIGATFSRSGWLSLMIGISALLFFINNRRNVVIIISSITAIILVFIFLTPFGDFIIFRFTSIFDLMGDISIRTRLFMAISGIEMFIDNPILGIGYRGFPILYDYYIHPLAPQELLSVKESHTLIITLLAETGIIGFGIVFLWFKKTFVDILRLIKEVDNLFIKALLIGSFANFVSFNINCLFYGNMFPHFNFFWLILAVIYSIELNKKELLKNE